MEELKSQKESKSTESVTKCNIGKLRIIAS